MATVTTGILIGRDDTTRVTMRGGDATLAVGDSAYLTGDARDVLAWLMSCEEKLLEVLAGVELLEKMP